MRRRVSGRGCLILIARSVQKSREAFRVMTPLPSGNRVNLKGTLCTRDGGSHRMPHQSVTGAPPQRLPRETSHWTHSGFTMLRLPTVTGETQAISPRAWHWETEPHRRCMAPLLSTNSVTGATKVARMTTSKYCAPWCATNEAQTAPPDSKANLEASAAMRGRTGCPRPLFHPGHLCLGPVLLPLSLEPYGGDASVL
jgi:hypothetical protein